MNRIISISVLCLAFVTLPTQINSKVIHPSFSVEAWRSIKPLYEKILGHPFNVQLSKGTLDDRIFTFYKRQDAYYLVTFSKTLAILASKLNRPQDIRLVLEFAKGSLNEGHDSQMATTHQISPANFAYTHFLLNTAAHGSDGELAAALLPCFWIYAEVAKDLKKESTINQGPYFEWISFYSSKNYRKDVDLMISLTNRLFLEADPEEQKKMREFFSTASKLELKFWDDAFHLKTF